MAKLRESHGCETPVRRRRPLYKHGGFHPPSPKTTCHWAGPGGHNPHAAGLQRRSTMKGGIFSLTPRLQNHYESTHLRTLVVKRERSGKLTCVSVSSFTSGTGKTALCAKTRNFQMSLEVTKSPHHQSIAHCSADFAGSEGIITSYETNWTTTESPSVRFSFIHLSM